MTKPQTEIDDNTPLEGSTFTPRQVRILKIVVVVLGILLVLGFALVVLTIVYQASQMGKDEAAAPMEQSRPVPMRASGEGAAYQLPVPPGAKVTGTDLDGNRIAVQLETEEGAEIVVIDLRHGEIVSRIRLAPDGAASDDRQ
ncbi:hypothetical protein V6C03_00320 [Methyloligella sp. 2.7D]|uniref:hypothetical protein n=1 Tax=unclassified Methyloligella TaxID=2625955 RepID=UPI00157D930E|nr:hypothetical protein [Methyloligella sp. GL2]QKP76881.1 hypothetical protein HT051_05090 [Methyloligella sp. GL2]